MDLRYNKNGFFNLYGYLTLCDTDWYKKDISLIINAPRNIGKSYGTWETIINEVWKKSLYKDKVAYCRTNLTKLKKAREDFNSKYYLELKEFYMSENKIYKVDFDESNKEIKENRIEVGSILGVENAENYKSLRFEGYRMIFWDEYNELNNTLNLWNKWIDLFKTIKRFNTPFLCLLVGNKVNANNDILVNLEIELDKEDRGDDIHVVRSGNIHFVDVSVKTFSNLNQENDLVNVWASYNAETDTYLNEGGYLKNQFWDVLIYRTRILPTKKIKYYLSYGTYKIEYGVFERGIYFHLVDEIDYNYKVLALDVLGNLTDSKAVKMLDETNYIDWANYVAKRAKKRELYYSSFDCKTLLEPYLIKLVNKNWLD